MRTIAPLLLLCCAGCASALASMFFIGGPGLHVEDSEAAIWNCRGDYVRIAALDYKKDLKPGEVFVPQVGWSACDLLSHNGAPRDYDVQQSAFGRSASLWYGPPSDPHLVTMELDGNRWVVDYVGW